MAAEVKDRPAEVHTRKFNVEMEETDETGRAKNTCKLNVRAPGLTHRIVFFGGKAR